MSVKVTTSEGMGEFIASGKTEEPPKEAEKAKPEPDLEPRKQEGQEDPEDEEGLSPEDQALAEKIRRKIGKKHRAMREAEEFAESQYNERKLAETRAQKLEQELAELKSRVAPPREDDPEPQRSKYTAEEQEKYWNERIKWEARQAVKKDREDREKEAAKEAFQKRADAFAKRLDAADRESPGLKDKLESSDVLIPQDVLDHIVESDVGPQVADYLADHPEYVESLRAMSPRGALVSIGKLETKLETKPAKPNGELSPRSQAERSSAPAPITPIQGSVTKPPEKDHNKMSFAEEKAWYNARKAEQRARH
jgi:signal recognition particle GTPase